ncbi:MAG: hypothetical protein ACI9DC_003015 [Gammaproteobacteria bacterium]|jgi:hypothetical protein
MSVPSLNPHTCARTPPAGGLVSGLCVLYGLGSRTAIGTAVGAGRRTLVRKALPVLATTCLLMSSASPALSLRLATELTTKPSVKGIDAATAQLIRFGTSDLQRRALETRQRTATVRLENRILREQISGTEELIARMQNFSGVQERTIGVFKSGIAWQQTAQASAQRAASSPPTPPPPPVVTKVQVAPTTRLATRPAVHTESARSSVAGIELPNWLLGGVVGALIAALLAWLLGVVARRREAAASTAGSDANAPPAAERSAIEQSDADVLRELWEHDGDSANSIGRQTESRAVSGLAARVIGESPLAADAGASTLVEDVDVTHAASSTRATDEVDSSRTMLSRKAAGLQALKEVDTLIAFEQFDKAKSLLNQMLAREPDNPEYMLRHYHVRTQSGVDTSADDAQLLRAMMDGPMSDTLLRVREIGRGLMPGNPLFDDNAQREEAVQVLKQERVAAAPVAEAAPDFMHTVVLNPGDAALQAAQKRAKD